MLFSWREILDVIIMVLAVGYIFKDVFKQHAGMSRNAFWFATAVTAPGLIAHELAHKFVAMAFGLAATFHAHYPFLAIGILLKLLHFDFIFFIPGYVSIPSAVTPDITAIVAVAGPLLNLLLFAGSWLLLRQKKLKTSTYLILQATKQINLFLFVFNMLPIPGLTDGWKFYESLFRLFF